jgi:lipoprotein Spr
MKQIVFIFFIGMALLVSSCSTIQFSNPGTKTDIDNHSDKKRSLYSEKLGIELNPSFDAALIKEVIDWLGTPYKYSGTDKSGTDCSGFVMQVYKTVYGIQTERSASTMYEKSTLVKREKLKQGQLVFFKINTSKVGHVGIFLQDPYFIHASSSKGVMVSSLDATYWTKYFVSGGKLIE